LIEEKPAQHITSNGVAIQFGAKDFNWCPEGCFIYFIVNAFEEQRYYVST